MIEAKKQRGINRLNTTWVSVNLNKLQKAALTDRPKLCPRLLQELKSPLASHHTSKRMQSESRHQAFARVVSP